MLWRLAKRAVYYSLMLPAGISMLFYMLFKSLAEMAEVDDED